jgi:hypothetical protein
MFHQPAELVAAQARQGIMLPELLLEHIAELAQQLIAGHVITGIIDDLE